jgi:Zn-finger nucleic acid-binding protein
VYTDPNLEPVFVPQAPDGRGRLYECVRCGNIMNRVNFKGISGIIIDICGDHGVWLDNKELERIRSFIASGGLDKAQDKLIQKNLGGIKVLASKVDSIKFMQNTLHRWSLKRILLRSGKIFE